ncbi:hypothetical protein [Ohtaekwangia koreensis]|nr:hypothetical protein [Ohtaekwangia koreensis]
MRTFIMSLLVISSLHASAQIKSSESSNSLLSFFRTKKTSDTFSFRAIKHAPVLSSADSYAPGQYWQTSSYTTYSENGRIRTTHIFDVNGQLRESRPSVSLKKSGALSYLRVQFSFQRQPTLFTYTIH